MVAIAVVGFLSGIIINLIRPEVHIKRAEDANVVSAMIKLIHAVGSYNATYGYLPDQNSDSCTCAAGDCKIFDLVNPGVVDCFLTENSAAPNTNKKIWMTVKHTKEGEETIGEYDLDDSDAIRYMPNRDGCLAALSGINHTEVFVWKHSVGKLMVCDVGEQAHPTATACTTSLYPNSCEDVTQ
jgi:hypothetical protein